jgi:hypothetical protein
LSIKKCTTAGKIPIILLNGKNTAIIDFEEGANANFKPWVSGSTKISNFNFCMEAYNKNGIIRDLNLTDTTQDKI